MQAFSFQKNEPLEFPKNGITEFEKLNDFLERMTKKTPQRLSADQGVFRESIP
ncbi:hypothetical protein [Algoriphagus boritolerans]|uniref:hypothetical protein n=1 Tax=Algoriphagus boritolerans TaxID=308111 RepID=UPI000ADD4379